MINRIPVLDLSDPLLFGNDAAEDEDPDVLGSYFVEKPEFRRFSSESTALAIVRARKGLGKSALLAHAAHSRRAIRDGSIVLQVKGADLTGMGEFTSADPAVLINQWQQVICAQINLEIGRRIGFAWTDNKMALVEASELAGIRSRNLVGALTERLRLKLKLDALDVELARPVAGKPSYILRNYSQEQERASVWLFVDDIDATFIDRDSMRLKTATFFSACRKLVSDTKGIKLRASVRTDVWTEIRRSDEALDKCEQYIVDLSWKPEESREILAKKILSYAHRSFPNNSYLSNWTMEDNANQALELVFPPTVRWRKWVIPTTSAIHRLSSGRPRWAGQLCRLSGDHAVRLSTKIDMSAITEALPRFGQLRLDDLYREHNHQFSELQNLIETFYDGYCRYTTFELERWIKNRMRIGRKDQRNITSLPLLYNRPVIDILELCHFLYKIGFIYGVKEQSDEQGHYTYYDDRPELLQNSTNPDDGLIWEVEASYRKVLRIKKDFHPERTNSQI